LRDHVHRPFWWRGIWPKATSIPGPFALIDGTRKIKSKTKSGQLHDELPEWGNRGRGESNEEKHGCEWLAHPPGACYGGEYVESKEREAYDARIRGANQNFRLIRDRRHGTK